VEQLELALAQLCQPVATFGLVQGRVEKRSSKAEPLECIDLVLHERDKWRQNQHRAGEDLGRNLEGERLTGTGWHDADAVASGEDGLDDLALAGSKRVVPEERFEHFLGGSGGRERDLHGWTLRDQVANPWLESGQLAS